MSLSYLVLRSLCFRFCFMYTSTTDSYTYGHTLSLHDALTIYHLGYHPPSKLKMAVSDQPCSSSPISVRDASAESVVLPVPDRPKKIAVSPSAPMLAEQCIGMTPCGGRTKLRTVKTAFFISPA